MPAASAPARLPRVGETTRVSGPATPGVVRGPMPPLLKDAVPRVTAILVSQDRRFATVDEGQIIGVGDLVGRRTVIAMDERSVLLQEPSGMQIRVGLGGRVMGLGRGPK